MPRSGRFTPGIQTGYLLYRRLGGPQSLSEQVRIISPGFDPRTAMPTELSRPTYRICLDLNRNCEGLLHNSSASPQIILHLG